MPGEATIGALRVVLGADTAAFETNLKSALGSLESFGKKAASLAAAAGIGLGLEQAFRGVVESITSAIDAADKLSKASQKFGIPVETLSALSNAAALSDVSLEQLGGSLSRLSKNMVAAQGPTSEQAVAFKALGISVKDAHGQLKNADDILLAVADSFSKFRDGTTKTALAVSIFGRAGADMIPFLDQGAAGIKRMTDRMAELGIVINADTAAAAEKFNDDLKLLAQAQQALVLKIVGESGLLAAMVQLAEAMLGGSRAATQLADIFTNKLGATLVEINKFVDDIRAGMASFGAGGETQSFLKALEDVGKTAAAAQAGGIDVLVQGVTSLEEAQKRLAAAPPAFDPNAAKNLEEFNKALTRLHDQALDASNIFAGQLAPGFLTATANLKQLQGQITLTGDGLVSLGPQAEAFNQAMLQLQGTQLALSLQDPWPKFAAEIPAMTAALQATGKTAEEVAALIEKAAQRAGVGWQTALSEILANATTAFTGLAQKNKEFASLAKALSIAQATFSAYEAFNKALATYPPPFNFIGAGVALAAGLATVAKIQATQFAHGGSFMVPGGSGGLDRMMAPIAMAPGERVDVTPASQGGGRGGRGVPRIELGVSMSDFITGSNLRDLVNALNEGARDGYKLRVVER